MSKKHWVAKTAMVLVSTFFLAQETMAQSVELPSGATGAVAQAETARQ